MGADHVGGVTVLCAVAVVVAGMFCTAAPRAQGAGAPDRMILAQQLPQAPPPVGKVRRGPDGRLLVVPDEPPKPPSDEATAPTDQRRAAAPKAAPVPPVTVEQAAPLAPLGPAPPMPEVPPAPVLAAPAPLLPRIILPEPFAIELPSAEQAMIRPQDSPLAELLGSAFAGGEAVTHDLLTPARPGITRVTFTAWQGTPVSSKVDIRATVPLLVLPNGQSPVGVSGDERATASNNASKVVRDDSGAIHLVWLETGAHGARVMYQRGYTRGPEGGTRWDGAPETLSAGLETPWNAYVGIVAVPGGAMVAWQGAQGLVLRRIVAGGGAAGWKIEAPIVTSIVSQGREMGPSIVARGEELSLLTPAGLLARSSDRGASWETEQMPLPDGQAIKNIAMDGDARGNLHVVFAGIVDEKYWELRYIRREPGGAWVDAHNVLADALLWQRAPDAHVLADFPTIRTDHNRGIHVAWHGTGNSRAYGKDEVFYRYRPSNAAGGWGSWHEMRLLWPIDREEYFGAFAPSLTLDPATSALLAVTFFVNKSERWEAGAVLLRDGRMVSDRRRLSSPREGGATPPTGVWFPSSAPLVYRAGDAAWLDVLQTVKLPAEEKAANVVVYQSVDVARWLGGRTAPELPMQFPDVAALPGIAWVMVGLGFLGVVAFGLFLRTLRWR